jgi:predicted HAD superfamily Cof-like phosphohydrolase
VTLHSAQEQVKAFHLATGATIGFTPDLRDNWLRAKLIAEEAMETVAAVGVNGFVEIQQPSADSPDDHWIIIPSRPKTDLAEAIDGLCDLIFVCLGAAVTWGIDLEPFWQEVVRSNMAKVGGPVREDGKRLKPEGWTPPDIEGILEEQLAAWPEPDEAEMAWVAGGWQGADY